MSKIGAAFHWVLSFIAGLIPWHRSAARGRTVIHVNIGYPQRLEPGMALKIGEKKLVKVFDVNGALGMLTIESKGVSE